MSFMLTWLLVIEHTLLHDPPTGLLATLLGPGALQAPAVFGFSTLRGNIRRSRFMTKWLIAAGLCLVALPMAARFTIRLVPFRRRLEATPRTESIGHSRPAGCCFVAALYALTLPGGFGAAALRFTQHRGQFSRRLSSGVTWRVDFRGERPRNIRRIFRRKRATERCSPDYLDTTLSTEFLRLSRATKPDPFIHGPRP